MTPLLCLHGALATQAQFDALRSYLSDDFELHTLDFEGHGTAPAPDRPLRAEHLVENVIAYLDEHQLEQVHLFGYSLGGYVASLVAQAHPERVARIVTLGTRFLWDTPTLERELRMAEPATLLAKVPRFVEALAQQHPASGWERVVEQTRHLLRANHETHGLPADVLATIPHPIRVMVGDRDSTAGVAESLAAYQSFPHGQFEVVPNTPHPFQKVDVERLSSTLREFFLN